MEIKSYVLHRMIKGEDLNHHGTLFAGRSAQWFVEAGFIAAASLTAPEKTLCLKIHGMLFKKPVSSGDIIRLESKIVHTGRTSLVSYVKVSDKENELLLDGFLTFIHVDAKGNPAPHGIIMDAVSPEDRLLQEKAKSLPKQGNYLEQA